MSAYKTLTELIISRKNEEQKGITFILGDTEEVYVSYKNLYCTSLRLLYNLQESGCKSGDEVIFQIDDNRSFVYSFWACILGGMIPVPVSTGTNDEHKLKLFKIWNILSNPRIIAAADFMKKLEAFALKNNMEEQMDIIKNRAVYVENSIEAESYGDIYYPEPDDTAFIQFSSGSTGEPKGVIITHNDVLINLNSVIRWSRIGSNDKGLNWMPLTHDMGLIGTHIKDVIACINQYNIQTALFIRHPSLWMQKASEHKVTLLYSPNFGYKHFLKFHHSGAGKEWDLSSIRMIYNGAEPISLELCNEFLDKMAEYGLKREAMQPVYGLAEGTIAVTFPRLGDELIYHTLDRSHLKIGETIMDVPGEDRNAVTFIDVGYPIYNCAVRICDEENNELDEDRIGYIQIRGGSVTSGYYNNEAATRAAISQDGWLNTGDLGFIRNNRLTITGRAKDVIFIAGQNYYSHDVERVGEDVEGIELGKIAVVGAFNERLMCDDLIIFVVFKQKTESFVPIALKLKRIISLKMGLEVSEVIPVKSIPKTTSGKVQRFKLREGYLNGEYDLIIRQMHVFMTEAFDKREIDTPLNALEEGLVKIWSGILDTKRIGIHDNFFELGGDSLRVTQLLSRISDTYAVDLEQAVIFNNPEIEKLAVVIEESLQNRSGIQDGITRVYEDYGKAPLSFAQQRLWFIDSFNKNSPQYNLCKVILFNGRLDRAALTRSFNEIIKRHKILQMSVAEENGQPVQVLTQHIEMAVDCIELKNIPEEKREKHALDLAAEEAGKPFDISKAPLIRGKLFCIDGNKHMLVLTAHHIVFDGWSFGILLKELNFFYEAFSGKEKRYLPELSIQYMDFIEWQTGRVKNGCMENQLAYWKRQLGGKLPVLNLPVDRQRPAVQTYNGAKFVTDVHGELVEKLQLYAREENVTLFMVLLAAFKVLLYRYSGQNDIIVGTPVANRNRKGIEDLIGLFTNNLVLRTNISGGMDFCTFLKQIRQTTLDAYSNQDVPFEKLVEELHIERDVSRNPLFQVLFSMQNTPVPRLEFPELDISSVDLDTGYARFDIAVDIHESEGELVVEFEYNTDIFKSDTINRMAGHLKQLLKSILINPRESLDKYEMLTGEEKNTLIHKWNKTEEDFGNINNWTELFRKQSRMSPGKTAVTCGNRRMSYRELDELSDKLALYLGSFGVGAESIVGIYMDRSIEMLAGLLGIHKAGAAYLPMDPIFPRERLAYMIQDSKVDIILSQKKFSEELPGKNVRIICMDEEWDAIQEVSADKPLNGGNACNLAYLIYTSGSTGRPKGVQIEQHALVNLLLSMTKKTGISSKDTLMAVTTLSFDIAGLELYMPLISGAGVVIARHEDVTDGRRLAEMIDKYGITIMQATPATWKLLIESGWSGGKNLKVLCGGEALSRNLANQLLDRCSMLINVYGPTETTIWSTTARIEAAAGPVSIGKPIANTLVYVVDKSMNPVPAGLPGELLIGGDGLARGYLNLHGLTREKFVPNPFCSDEGARLYKTGDMVKYSADGSLEFIGRMDDQIKIRGFRIEPGEIETLLNKIPGVRESIVVEREMIPGENSLAAYIIPSPDGSREALDNAYLRKKLKDMLPDYMIPAAFVFMESYPMTENGKINKKALPMPEMRRVGLETDNPIPVSETEKTVAAIWKETLKLERVGVNDNFFDLGGHSLLLAQVRSRMEKAFNREISMLTLFKYPTIDALSKFLAGVSGIRTVIEPEMRAPGRAGGEGIAVIGMSGRFPGASNIEEFWKNLCNGVESISRFTDEQVLEEGISPDVLNKPGYVKAWGALDDIDRFDADFFGYNPREAEVLDPQQRIFHEESWKALENAGYDSEKYNGVIGIYASTGMNTYAQYLKEDGSSKGLANDYQIMISNDKDFLATRIAYKMNLGGPGVTVQTACSSSLVAVHLACRSLIDGECDMALAGGVSIRLPQRSGYLYQEGMILSPDGHCRAFNKDAKGTVGGNGAGVVVLKRLEDAVEDGDDICAVIKGSAVNNDGSLKIGYTAPGIDGQARAVAEAQNKAGVEPGTITYIEAHGTGTPLGDPIEMEALCQVFKGKMEKKQFCAVGSVKTNVGHLDAAAGVTGLIKTVLALRNKKIPPSLNFGSPNPKINFEDSPFFVNKALIEWGNSSIPLRAGVSSFGIGGTNVHVVLEEAPSLMRDGNDTLQPCLLAFSAKSKKALDKMTAGLIGFFKANEDVNLHDAAYTLHMGRREFDYRRFIVCTSVKDAVEMLENINNSTGQVSNRQKGETAAHSRQVINDLEQYSLEQLGNMWLEGAGINWARLYEGQKRKRTALPTYPFEGRVYWPQRSSSSDTTQPASKAAKKADVSEWFYTPLWKQSVRDIYFKGAGEAGSEVFLILKNENSFSDAFISRLREHGIDIVTATSGETYEMIGKNSFILDTANPEHYDNLLNDMSEMGRTPSRVVNLLGISAANCTMTQEQRLDFGEKLFFSMLYIAQAAGRQPETVPLQIKVVTDSTYKIFGEQDLYPEKALNIGACRVIPQEYPDIRCCSIDLILPEPGSITEQEMIDRLAGEICLQSDETADETVAVYRGPERWILEYEPVKLNHKGNPAVKIKNDGVYIITGGLGGLGLVMAGYLAGEAKVKLILAGRSEFPDEELWDNWIAACGKKDSISRKIAALKQLQAKGAEICTYCVDVSDTGQMRGLREKVEKRFGRIDGVIHAAGNAGGGMIQLKRKEVAGQVLAPKVRGTVSVYEAFRDCKLDFIILFSSLNAITGGFGQIDYCAANTFLDAFAQVHDSHGGTRIISINWDRWPGVGMASRTLNGTRSEDVHPLLGRCISDTSEEVIYSEVLSPKADWVLSEHLIMNTPTAAGTTFIEMMRAAFEDITGSSRMQISDVVFSSPMASKTGEKRVVYTIAKRNGDSLDFRVVSRSSNEAEKSIWLEHTRGKAAHLNDISDETANIGRIKEICSTKTIFASESGQRYSQEFISFGARWNSLKKFTLGDKAGLVEVEMAEKYIDDLEDYKLHPALLDVATGAVRLAVEGDYLPLSYKKIEIRRRLEGKMYSFVKFKDDYGISPEAITCDINILSENGELLVSVSGFSMKLISDTDAVAVKSGSKTMIRQLDYRYVEKLAQDSAVRQKRGLNEGISEKEGREVFELILKGCSRPQMIVSTRDLKTAVEKANYIQQPSAGDILDEAAAVREKHPRPELENEYVSPKNEMERKLAELWENTLCIDGVGIHDEFFDLGGDSLLLIQMHTRLKDTFKTDISVVDLYKYNTVALLARYLNSDDYPEAKPAFNEVNNRVNKQLEIMRRRRQQMQQKKGVIIDGQVRGNQ